MTSPTVCTPLPPDFAPGDHDVVIGKGKKFYFHGGNIWLREVVTDRVDDYRKATTKAEKSNVITDAVDYIRANGRFVKLDAAGQWVMAEDLLCREKCGATFRDTLRAAAAPKPAKIGSSSDLIQALMKAKISSSGNSSQNLSRIAMSTGNLLKSRSGQFSAAKKASFSKLSDAAAFGNSAPGRGNATWSPRKKANAPPMVRMGSGRKLNMFQDLLIVPPRNAPTGASGHDPNNNPLSIGARAKMQHQLSPQLEPTPMREDTTSLGGGGGGPMPPLLEPTPIGSTPQNGNDMVMSLQQLDAQLLQQTPGSVQPMSKTTGVPAPILEDHLDPLLQMPIMEIGNEDHDHDLEPFVADTSLNEVF